MTIATDNQFNARVEASQGGPLIAHAIDTIQVNIGLRCNLACHHCHVESSPKREQAMSWHTLERILEFGRQANVKTIDITGGAPEMNVNFRRFVTEARNAGFDVIVRTNLTIALDEGYQGLPQFFREQRVHLIASLPCYLEENVDKQRGKRVYQGSIAVIKRLNAEGYGIDPDLILDLVYNPGGPSLPPSQAMLQDAYKRELRARFNIEFSNLFTITNMAIGRFLHDLQREGQDQKYLQLLRESFNAGTLENLMCRHQIHVSWDGTINDCDFNYALGIPVGIPGSRSIHDVDPDQLQNRCIVTEEHCFACTAGSGSSCGGALT